MNNSRGVLVVLALAACSSSGGDDQGSPDAMPMDGSTDQSVPADAGVDAWKPLPPTPAEPELWYWHHSYLSGTSSIEPAHSEALIDEAVAAGYTGLAFWDSSLSYLNMTGWDSSKLQTVITYAQSKGLSLLAYTAPFGYSNDALMMDPNLAEGMHVVGTQYTVSGSSLQIKNSLPPLTNGDFSSGGTGWFGTGDPCLGVDTTEGYMSSSSAKLSASSSNCRLTQAVTLTPWRLYHVRFFAQSSGFSGGDVMLEVLDFSTSTTIARINATPTIAGSQGWTEYDYTFNSAETTKATIYLGVWGGFSGTVWIDDVSAEETGLINVLRRGGTPLRVYDGATTYVEGTDFDAISDPALAAHPGTYDFWHTPPTVTLPSGTSLQQNATVSIDHYTVYPAVSDGDVGMCLNDPGVFQWITTNMSLLAGLFPPTSGIFIGYDEMRHMNTCQLCASMGLDAGPLLANNVPAVWKIVSAAMPQAQPYVWNDMFDPNMNAVDDYYYVQGNIAGSWAGLQPGMIIMNWNVGSAAGLTKSLAWFSGSATGQPHAFQQIIAGYYDSGDGTSSANLEMGAAMGIPGVIGAMYTTWEDDYSQLSQFATAIKAQWAAYKASVSM